MTNHFKNQLKGLASGTGTKANKRIPLEAIEPNPDQPRKHFGKAAMESLTRSIEQQGVLVPIGLKPLGDSKYMIVYGERRYRASLNAGQKDIPAVVFEGKSEDELRLIAVTENLQRDDLNPIEESREKARFIAAQLKVPVEELEKTLYRLDRESKLEGPEHLEQQSQANLLIEQVTASLQLLGGEAFNSFLKNKLPVLRFPEDLVHAVEELQLDYSKALLLTRIPAVEDRKKWIERILQEDLSVKEIRALLKKPTPKKQHPLDDFKKYLNYNRYNKLGSAERERVNQLLEELKGVLSK